MIERGNGMKQHDKRLHSRGENSLASECKRRRVAYIYGSHDKEVRGIPDVRVLMLRCERVAQVVHSGEPPLRSTRDVLPGP